MVVDYVNRYDFWMLGYCKRFIWLGLGDNQVKKIHVGRPFFLMFFVCMYICVSPFFFFFTDVSNLKQRVLLSILTKIQVDESP